MLEQDGTRTQDGASADHRSYIVRLRRDGAGYPWRAEAQSITSAGIRRFASVEALCAFLLIELEAGEQIGHEAHEDIAQ